MIDPSLRILVIDDSAVLRTIVKKHLNRMGFEQIFEAQDGSRGLAVLRSEKIDLIISDWCMPVMTGIELLRHIRQDSRWKDLPFIMLTAEGQQHLIDLAIAEKTDQYILKPFTFNILSQNIQQVLSARSLKNQ